jgi:hypothetical protein
MSAVQRLDMALIMARGIRNEMSGFKLSLSFVRTLPSSNLISDIKRPYQDIISKARLQLRLEPYIGAFLKHILPINLACFLSLYCRGKTENEAIVWQ